VENGTHTHRERLGKTELTQGSRPKNKNKWELRELQILAPRQSPDSECGGAQSPITKNLDLRSRNGAINRVCERGQVRMPSHIWSCVSCIGNPPSFRCRTVHKVNNQTQLIPTGDSTNKTISISYFLPPL